MIKTNDELLAEKVVEAEAYAVKLSLAKRCAICKMELGDLNGPEGEEPLKIHFEANHPGESLRMELVK